MPTTTDLWNADLYEGQHAYVYEFGHALLDRLRPAGNERILDLGCGTGRLTSSIAEIADAVGVDSSPEMLATAAKHYPNLTFIEADAASLPFADEFDAVFSNAALHWVKDLEGMARGVYRALRPRGRFVAEMGARGNVEALVSALYLAMEANGIEDAQNRNPWRFPSLGQMSSLLEAAGFVVAEAMVFERPVGLEGGQEGLRKWYEVFGQPFLSGLPKKKVEAILDYAEFILQESLYIHETWYADYRRLRFVAYRG